VHRPFGSLLSGALILFCPLLVASPALAQGASASADKASAQLKPEEIQALVAPIALYPDPLLAQVLMASTYPLEVVQAARWSKENPKVTGKGLEDAMLKQTWDASVKSLCSFPDTLAMMNDKLDWTQKLGDTFLAQQDDVMEAVQVLRAKAQASGNLKSSKELTVSSEKPQAPPADAGVAVQPVTQTIIVIQPANPQVVYVPQYNPTVVYGVWPYPAYPPYPVYPPGYVAATAAISFGVGLAVGAAMWGNCSWGYRGYSSVTINVNNYNRYNHTNINVNVNNRNTANWNHNSNHRHGVPYTNSASQQRYGGSRSAADAQSRDAFRGREGGVPNSGNKPAQRPSGGAATAGQAPRPASGGAGAQRPAGGGGGVQRPENAAAQRPGSGGGGTQRPAGGGGSQAGGGAFQGMNNGGQARADSARGHASLGGGGGRGGGGQRR
jgi:hypothetical protein